MQLPAAVDISVLWMEVGHVFLEDMVDVHHDIDHVHVAVVVDITLCVAGDGYLETHGVGMDGVVGGRGEEDVLHPSFLHPVGEVSIGLEGERDDGASGA